MFSNFLFKPSKLTLLVVIIDFKSNLSSSILGNLLSISLTLSTTSEGDNLRISLPILVDISDFNKLRISLPILNATSDLDKLFISFPILDTISDFVKLPILDKLFI